MLAMRLFRRQKVVNEEHTGATAIPAAKTSDGAAERDTLDDKNYQTVKAVPAFITTDSTFQQQVKSHRKGESKLLYYFPCLFSLSKFGVNRERKVTRQLLSLDLELNK